MDLSFQWLTYEVYTSNININFHINFSSNLVYANSINSLSSGEANWNDSIINFNLNYFTYIDNKARNGNTNFFRQGFALAIGF